MCRELGTWDCDCLPDLDESGLVQDIDGYSVNDLRQSDDVLARRVM